LEERIIAKKFVKLLLVLVMLAGIGFSIFNYIALKAEATVYWQKLETGIDPVTGGMFIRCFSTGSGCCTVEEPAY
jgi:hypothetical protein